MPSLLSYGMFGFSMATLAHDELSRRRNWRHATSSRIGARDATQFTGPGEDTVSIQGSALAELQDGRASLDQLAAMAATGEPWPLVDGLGRIYGSFVITALDERQKHFFPNGEPRRIDFSVDLLAVDDPERSA
ncbi:phage tail protein [Sphingomonas oligophenolica]|uniref:Phage tail protein n=1 Tax=Sphingomonas oligophenolica TaxID=301154 RepID=A0A502CNE5_9SPHN|nr:phage tail protein [Sphingomonas oligophenolica]TPG14378.1 phage tail protein [Sphingomonas oligophenolica]